jgi:hypothetical protein
MPASGDWWYFNGGGKSTFADHGADKKIVVNQLR